MLTFDDGYRECFSEALPILRRHGAVATFFVATHYVEARRLLWWDRIALLLHRSERAQLQLHYPFELRLPLGEARQEAAKALLAIVKSYAGLDHERFLDHVAEACGVHLERSEERRIVDRLLMTWDELRALERAGMEVESHTRTHRVMNTLSSQDVCEELMGSRIDLEAQLGRRVRALAYPVGYPVRHLPYMRDALRRTGYELAFTNQTGVNHTLMRGDRFGVRRISMCCGYDDAFFRAILSVPYLAPARQRLPEPLMRSLMPEQNAAALPPADRQSRALAETRAATPRLHT
jgi:peptidoglycan/xylan/chitin deacetylase (PgdA/CDA1 family)